MKIIFLDIDGPLQTMKVLAAQTQHWGLAVKMDPISVQLLDKICKLTDAKIVISSTWRHAFGTTETMAFLYMYGLDARRSFFQWNDIPDSQRMAIECKYDLDNPKDKKEFDELKGQIVGTPRNHSRTQEIRDWLEMVDHKSWITHFAIIDDAFIEEDLQPNWVETRSPDGFGYLDYKRTLELLGYNKDPLQEI